MADLQEYLAKRGISSAQMDEARRDTQAKIDAYTLREARKASHMTQVQLAQAMGVSQNRVSRIESGDLDAMSVDSLRRYVNALGGSLTLVATLPTGQVRLT
ncbi:helix-turn-helix domain-containing protein [Xiamenia xianingshaonis]|uniref:Helix-turn-helix domain-containing protein n=1 Tax=Xiamenia xianingshaonis TaxID=2682776 RepID=A0A9E6MRM5_9ACTN|nr:helix-turn-helix transcriptional regulator [Xiamenia xianingshaonis]NGM17544.1 helix-turn-helix domain-containing protein [Eggerthellaceae bacterium zg-893]NHM13216.1 helix-turn-helix domain-containing protein [Xiamenia xianingshaonis]QTU84694.1 helix-turn-helix transcriptional regulator [Xiamenia xianingshaonis]